MRRSRSWELSKAGFPRRAARQALLAKISALPDARVSEVEDFVDFLQARDQDKSLVFASQAASEPAFTAVWSNPEDSDYDAL